MKKLPLRPLRQRYFKKLILLLLSSYLIFFSILCIVEFRKAIFHPEKLPEATHEVTVFFMVGLASLPIAVFIAWRLTQSLLTPLREMVATAEHIGGGDFSSRIQLKETYDELDQLGASFNLAFDRYENALDQLRNFSGDAAHQLRTPLTVIQSTGEAALLSDSDPEAYKEAIEQMLEELRSLKQTVNQLLQLSGLEDGLLQQSFTHCDISKVICASCERFKPLAESKGIRMQCHLLKGSASKGHPDLLEQALANLLDNAIRHTPDGGFINIIQTGTGFIVEDSGSGISEDMLPHLFEQFRKGNKTGQSGLGLAIVERIIQLHRGNVTAENRKDGGARFRIVLS